MEWEQKFYKDDNGRPIESNKIQSIGIIKYGSDGFYHWQCVDCNSVTSSRSCGWAMFKDALISILTRGYYEGNYYTESLDKYLGDPNYKELTSKDYNVLWI